MNEVISIKDTEDPVFSITVRQKFFLLNDVVKPAETKTKIIAERQILRSQQQLV